MAVVVVVKAICLHATYLAHNKSHLSCNTPHTVVVTHNSKPSVDCKLVAHIASSGNRSSCDVQGLLLAVLPSVCGTGSKVQCSEIGFYEEACRCHQVCRL